MHFGGDLRLPAIPIPIFAIRQLYLKVLGNNVVSSTTWPWPAGSAARILAASSPIEPIITCSAGVRGRVLISNRGFPKWRYPQNHPKLDYVRIETHGFGDPPLEETTISSRACVDWLHLRTGRQRCQYWIPIGGMVIQTTNPSVVPREFPFGPDLLVVKMFPFIFFLLKPWVCCE